MGRPLKYQHVLYALESEEVYSPAKIAQFALEENLLETGTNEWTARERVRIAMGRFAKSKKFPFDGDARVVLEGQAPTPGWFGWRWKDAAGLD